MQTLGQVLQVSLAAKVVAMHLGARQGIEANINDQRQSLSVWSCTQLGAASHTLSALIQQSLVALV